MIDAAALRRRPPRIDRSSDRWVALASIAIALAFLAAAALTTLLPEVTRRVAWVPLHLALAGGATTAIAGVMPFFSAAIAAAPPSDARLRAAAVAAVALGAAGVSWGVAAGPAGLAVASGALFIAGLVLVAVVTVRPLGRALGPSRGIVTRGYVAAIAQVVVGASITTLYLAGWTPLIEAWAHAKPAHAWLNVMGFVSLVIATTLLHFFPTVVGTRIAPHRSARAAVAGLGFGAPAVALGELLALDIVARAGAIVFLAGAAGLTVYAARIWRSRARWTTDAGWHAFAMGGLVSAIAWFDLGALVAAGRVLVAGADPSGWSILAVGAPLGAGWAGLAVVASATHLVPAVGPGDQAVHARQRRLLGRAGLARLVLVDLGVAGLAAGLATGVEPLAVAGMALLGLGFGSTVVLLAGGVALGARSRTATPPATRETSGETSRETSGAPPA